MKTILSMVLLCANASGADDDSTNTTVLRSLVETERAFAGTCGEKGVRASFLEFFADDGIAFRPEPFRFKEAMKDLPPPSDPLGVTLEWEPQAGGVAASGDLGYTTGPSVRTDKTAEDKPQRFGQFFSVWKKQKDGRWKVAADIGVATPARMTPLGKPFKQPRTIASAPMTKGNGSTSQ